MTRRALVLGASGYIAHFVTAQLLADGWDVTALSRRPRPDAAPPDGRLRWQQADTGDAAALEPLVAAADAVFPLMGSPGAGRGLLDPLTEADNVYRSHLPLIEALARTRSEARVVLPGSRLQYGVPRTLPVDEAQPLAPVCLYGLLKTAAEHTYLVYHSSMHLHVTPLRITNVFGPEVPGHAGRTSSVFSRFVAIASEDRPIRLYGGGTSVRDFVHVADVARCMVAAATTMRADGQPLNVGSGSGRSLRSVAQAVIDAVGRGSIEDVPFPAELAAVETGDFVADVRRVRQFLSWTATLTIEDAVSDLVPTQT